MLKRRCPSPDAGAPGTAGGWLGLAGSSAPRARFARFDGDLALAVPGRSDGEAAKRFGRLAPGGVTTLGPGGAGEPAAFRLVLPVPGRGGVVNVSVARAPIAGIPPRSDPRRVDD